MPFTRLLLIVPPQLLLMEGFRTALVALAAYVGRKLPELDIKLLDLSTIDPSAIRSVIESALCGHAGRTVAGISTVTADYQAALTVAKELKDLDPNIVTIFGGHHASGDAKVILREHPRLVDYVICGEGEIPLYIFLDLFPAVDNVAGLAFRSNGSIVINAPPKLLDQEDLDIVPLAYGGWELSSAPGKFDHVTYVSARGCPLTCAFCAVANQKIRYKSISQVLRDVRTLVASGFSRIAFEDNFFAHNKERTRLLCEALVNLRADGLNFTWDCQTRVESMDHQETISLMQKAGCEAVYLGVESLHEGVLRFLGKTANPRRYLSRLTEHVVPSLLDSKIDCYINLQFGLPGEITSTDEIETNVSIMARLGQMAARRGKAITVFPQLFVVYPGTAHTHLYLSARLFPEDVFETFTAWEAKNKPILKWLGETFAHGAGGVPLGILDQHSLWNRQYKIDKEATERVSNTINRLDGLDGVNVFRYGKYLVTESSDAHKCVQSTETAHASPRLVVSSGRVLAGAA